MSTKAGPDLRKYARLRSSFVAHRALANVYRLCRRCRYMDKKLQSTTCVIPLQTPVHAPSHSRGLLVAVKLNGNRNVSGTLRGFDQFLNIVLDNTVEEVSATERNNVGMVVRLLVPLLPNAHLEPNGRRSMHRRHDRRRSVSCKRR